MGSLTAALYYFEEQWQAHLVGLGLAGSSGGPRIEAGPGWRVKRPWTPPTTRPTLEP